ncbi:MAG: DUF177 domain-containing protein [Patescibacteria group bacterium]
MSTKELIFDVADMLNVSTGTREIYSFDVPLEYEGIPTKSFTSGKAEVMRIEEGFNVSLKEVEVEVEFTCSKCLKIFKQKVLIPQTERQFLMEKPIKIDDLQDLYLVNKKRFTIEVSEILRQEIILHFPLNPVCSKSCKGICPICGKDRNKEKCSCVQEIKPPENKPLATLKNLLKSN